MRSFGGLMTWMQSTDLLNFITDHTPEQEAMLELETFLLRLTSDFMSNHGQVAQLFFYNLNKTIMEVMSPRKRRSFGEIFDRNTRCRESDAIATSNKESKGYHGTATNDIRKLFSH